MEYEIKKRLLETSDKTKRVYQLLYCISKRQCRKKLLNLSIFQSMKIRIQIKKNNNFIHLG